MFSIAFTPSARDDFAWFRKTDQQVIFDQVSRQLTHEPHLETRHRKRLRPNPVARWELRIGAFRVLYDIDSPQDLVEVKLVGYKEGNKLMVQGQEVKL